MNRTSVMTVLSLSLLAACKPAPAPAAGAAPAASAESAQAATSPGLNPSIEQPAAPPPAEAVIVSQPGENGSRWDLTRLKVTGNLLTAQFTVHASSDKSLYEHYKIDSISLIDDMTSQRYSVVKDQDGKAMVSKESGGDLELGLQNGESGVVWIKFPAPPATATTVSITIPEVAPFDGVTIQR